VPAASTGQPFGLAPSGAFSVEDSSGTAPAYNRFSNISVAYAGRRSFDYNSTGKDSFFGCYSLDPATTNYRVGGMSSWYGCEYSGGEVAWLLNSNEALISGSKISRGTLVSSGGDVNAVLIYALATADAGVGLVMFEGCRFQSNPPSGVGAGNALLLVAPNTGRTINARFSGCTWNAYGNQSTVTVPYFAYIESGVEGKIEIDGGVVAGTPAIGTFVDDSGNNVLSVRNVQGFNPTGAQTAPTVPASGTALTNPFPFDCTVYVNGGTVTEVAVGGTSTGATGGAFRVAAGQSITLTYSAAPTWTWFGD
jgi:hypothetical protein